MNFESQNVIELKDILDTKAIQSLMDDFYSITNFGIGILDLKGEVLVGTGWQDVCTKFHRVNSLTLNNCVESDTYLTQNVKRGEFLEYKCKNNLRDIVTPIFVNDQHVGNIFLGQFMYDDETPEYDMFLDQAAFYGFDKDEYLSALSRVPRWSRQKVDNVMHFYSKFAQIISDLLTSNLRLKETLAEKEGLIRDLNRSNKELEQYAYVASHDLQEPLRMVSSYTRLLERDLKSFLDDRSRAHMDFIVDGAKRMHSLIQDLLLFSRVTSKKNPFIPTDLKMVVDDAVMDLHKEVVQSNVEIKIEGMPVIKTDAKMIKKLFHNLISNAIKFKGDSDPVIYIGAEQKDKNWVFFVKDNGMGISSEYFDKIFLMFNKLHNHTAYPGTGIGLTLCKKIVEYLGGKIWVESEEGMGTTFFFTIPM